MKQLVVNVVKDVAINDLVCSPNVIFLAKQSTITNEKKCEVRTNVRYIEVCQVDKTDSLTIVKSLLKYCVAEHFVCNELEKDFAEANVKQRKLFNQFLSTNTIYRTNSEGRVSNALVSEIPLNQTALKVRDYHTITTCEKGNLNAAIYQHSKAILAQCKYLRLIIDKAKSLEDNQLDDKVTDNVTNAAESVIGQTVNKEAEAKAQKEAEKAAKAAAKAAVKAQKEAEKEAKAAAKAQKEAEREAQKATILIPVSSTAVAVPAV